jgi:hypothetical protein
MKYISVLVLLFMLKLSWAAINRPFEISPATHEQLQVELSKIIEGVISQSNPTVSDIKMEKVWTETVNYNRVKASFGYSYKEKIGEDTLSQYRQGIAFLTRQPPPPDHAGVDSAWSLDQVKVLNTRLDFENGTTISKARGVLNQEPSAETTKTESEPEAK